MAEEVQGLNGPTELSTLAAQVHVLGGAGNTHGVVKPLRCNEVTVDVQERLAQ